MVTGVAGNQDNGASDQTLM